MQKFDTFGFLNGINKLEKVHTNFNHFEILTTNWKIKNVFEEKSLNNWHYLKCDNKRIKSSFHVKIAKNIKIQVKNLIKIHLK